MSSYDDDELDRTMIAEVRELGGDDLLDELVTLFQSDLDRIFPELGGAISAGDRVATARFAHAIKGGSANIGAVRLASAASDLEQASSSVGLDQIQVLADELKVRSRRAVEQLMSETGRLVGNDSGFPAGPRRQES